MRGADVRVVRDVDPFEFTRMFALALSPAGSWAMRPDPGATHTGPQVSFVSVVVVRAGRMIGCLAGRVKDGPVFCSSGTWVSRRWRRRGLAGQMWQCMMEEVRPQHVSLVAVTDNGLTLAKALQERFSGVSIHVSEDGNRKLRDLRSKHEQREK